jgi:hypothetical protein
VEPLVHEVLSHSIRGTLHIEQLERACDVGTLGDVDGAAGTWDAADVGIVLHGKVVCSLIATIGQFAEAEVFGVVIIFGGAVE